MATGKLRFARIAAAIVALLLLGAAASSALADGDPSAPAASPAIASDQADYAPGSTVTLSGSGWHPTETVHVLVNDTLGKTWQFEADVLADLDGAFTVQFQLPNTFISDYDVSANGTWNDNATTSFTDGNATDATVDVRKSDCLTSATSFISGDTVCTHSVITSVTSGTGDISVQFVPPTGATTKLSHTGLPGAAFDDSLVVSITGTWTVNVCTNNSCPASAILAHETFTVAAKQNQTIAFNQPTSPQSFGATFNVNPAASSGLPVAVTAQVGSVCTVAAATPGFDVTMTASSGSCILNANQGGNALFNAAPQVSRTVSAQKASATTTVSCPASVDYTGSAQAPCTAVVTGAGGLNQSLTVTYASNTNVGTATANASFTGDANHNASSDSKTFAIAKATSATAVTCPISVVYTGSAQTPCTAAVTGAGSLSQALTVTYGSNTNVGTATASASFPGDANHNASSDSKTFAITNASSATTVTCAAGPFVYTGSPQTPCTALVTGAGGFNQTLTVTYTGNTNAGTAQASAGFGGDANHDSSSDSKTFTIGQAPATVSITWADTTYSGSPHPASASVTGVGSPAENLGAASSLTYYSGTGTSGTALADAPVAAGTYTVEADFNGNTNYVFAAATTTVTVAKADSTTKVTCTAGPFVYDGTPQTPCSASVTGAGGLDLHPAPDYADNTNAGTATASYTYAGDDNHTPSSDSTTFTIDQAPTTTTVTCTAGPFVYDSTPQTPCSVSVTGAGNLDLTPTPDYADNTNAGTATASYDYAGDDNHEPSSDSKPFTIDKATPSVSATWSDWTYDGTAHAATGSVSGVGSPAEPLGTPNVFAYYSGSTAIGTPLPGAPTDAGTYTVVAHYNDSGNYAQADSAPKTVTVAKATPTVTITWATPQTYNGGTHPATTAVKGVGTPPALLGTADALTYYAGSTASGIPLGGAPVAAGTYTVQADFNTTTNYLAQSATATITISKATSTTTVTCPATANYTATALTPCTASVTGAGGLSQALPVTHTNNTAVGTAGAAATYSGDANHYGGSDSKTFKIVYGDGDVQFLQPINGTAHNLSTNPDVSTFKAGSTIPVKVQVKLPNGTIVHPASATWLTPQKGVATTQPIDETVYSDPASSGATFAWDPTGPFYQFNWGTPKTGGGFYYGIGVKLDDGQTYTVYISLR
jgi:hypothetical protein